MPLAVAGPGTPRTAPIGLATPYVWEPPTDHTIDAGVVAIGTDGAALSWVADED